MIDIQKAEEEILVHQQAMERLDYKDFWDTSDREYYTSARIKIRKLREAIENQKACVCENI